MEKFVINGGKIDGSIKIESAKNAVLPMIACAILTEEEVVIKSCPKILDVLSMIRILKKLGVKADFEGENLVINSLGLNSCFINEELTKGLRTSVLMLGALIGRCNSVRITYPGGCEIGKRPIDLHLEALKKLGVKVEDDEREIFCYTDNLIGGEMFLPIPSVGATENILLASVRAKGITKVHNYAKEPEVIDLIKMLNKMGAKIVADEDLLSIEGVKKLNGVEYKPISDRIEAGTFLLAGAITGGKIQIKNANPQNILPLLGKFCESTCKIDLTNDIIYLKSITSRRAFNLTTGPYPLFPTDLQPQTTILACVSDGQSRICEKVFENRFGYTSELVKMGADISVYKDTAIVKGVKRLHGAKLYAKDLRGGASLVLAGLVAEGQTEVYGVKHIERGYHNFDGKLKALGAKIKREG